MVTVIATSSRRAGRRLGNAAATFRRLCSPCAVVFLFLGIFLLRGCVSLFHNIWACPASIGGENGHICFVTCIFGDSVEQVDHPANVEWFAEHWCDTQFMLVTNLPDLPSPGWTKIVQDIPSTGASDSQLHSGNSHIVQSREAKFLAWKVLPVQHCSAVFYMDGYLEPRFSWTPSKFRAIVEQVQSHPWGLSQVQQKYFNGLNMSTILNNLVRDRKDTAEHVDVTLSWLREQDDYQEVMTYYLNKYFGKVRALSGCLLFDCRNHSLSTCGYQPTTRRTKTIASYLAGFGSNIRAMEVCGGISRYGHMLCIISIVRQA